MNYYITEKPQNLCKKHSVKGWQQIKKLFKEKIKKEPNKNWLLEDENHGLLLCTWDDVEKEESKLW